MRSEQNCAYLAGDRRESDGRVPVQITLSNLTQYVTVYPDHPPRTVALENKIQIGTGFHGKWYRSQREHWLGWLGYHHHKIYNGGKKPESVDAAKIWNSLACSPMLFWLAESGGASVMLLEGAEQAAITAAAANPKDGHPHGRLIREVLPWSLVRDSILRGKQPPSNATAAAEAYKAFDRLCELRPEFRKFRSAGQSGRIESGRKG